ncbi:histidine phosphatase family protein [Vagococcus fluvialis]|uniref:histidine phosphatase family protein n=1 Tax=Vagococcus fluvialis TaxID=2738 RepID=UPI001A8CD7CD|nr:histidine phosphatase family protein [Vagococcus fluvialis]MBO0428928.1 histidine phosphatase family protein [Vagococcus fluvialis]
MKNIYFVRHSLRDFTIRDDKSVPLTSDGKNLARKLVPFFLDKNIEKIYTSPYLRAVQTIEPVASELNIKPIQIEDLRERNVGKWVENFSEFSRNQWNDFDFKLENGESLNEVKNRMLATFDNILKEQDSNVIISGHGTSLAILFHEITEGKFGFREFNEMKMPDIYCAEYKNNKLLTLDNIQY